MNRTQRRSVMRQVKAYEKENGERKIAFFRVRHRCANSQRQQWFKSYAEANAVVAPLRRTEKFPRKPCLKACRVVARLAA